MPRVKRALAAEDRQRQEHEGHPVASADRLADPCIELRVILGQDRCELRNRRAADRDVFQQSSSFRLHGVPSFPATHLKN